MNRTFIIRYTDKPGVRAALWRYLGLKLARSNWYRRGVDEQRLYQYGIWQRKPLYITEDQYNAMMAKMEAEK
jgi:hypothetical protein